MGNVTFLTATKENGVVKLKDGIGNYFKLPENTSFLQRIEALADNPMKVVRVYHMRDKTLAYFPALKSKVPDVEKIGMPIVTETNFPELWANLESETQARDNTPLSDQQKFIQKLNELVKAKPSRLKLKDIKWKYVCRCALKGKNIMMLGEKGSGKTLTAYMLAKVLPEQPFFKINLGATQDPRGELIGNTHFDVKEGTIFKPSPFIKAIQTPGANILLDEISRAHPDAWNILMTVLDQDQRYLVLSEDPDSPTINVAPGVSFIATANRGIKYTSTRAIDAALADRFIFIEFDLMKKKDMEDLLMELYPNGQKRYAQAIAGIYDTITKAVNDEKIQEILSTRQCIEAMDLLSTGFTLPETAETAIYPFFDKDGGTDSDRVFVQQTVQKYIPTEPEKNSSEFTQEDWDFENLSNDKPF